MGGAPPLPLDFTPQVPKKGQFFALFLRGPRILFGTAGVAKTAVFAAEVGDPKSLLKSPEPQGRFRGRLTRAAASLGLLGFDEVKTKQQPEGSDLCLVPRRTLHKSDLLRQLCKPNDS